MTPIVYIIAHSRSGSTLLARMLGQVENWISVGEVRYLWRRGMVENQPCGCGEAFDACTFWRRVASVAFGPVSPSMAANMAEAVRHADRVWRMGWGSSAAFGAGKPDRRTAEALRWMTALYDAISQVSGASVIVDSSKSPSYGQLLGRTPGARVHLVHLVRDGRGVAYSRLRRVARGELRAKSERVLVARTALEWAVVNGLAQRLRQRMPYSLVRYEDFVADPRATLLRIAAEVGLPEPSLPFLDGHRACLGPDHTVSGNQMRFKSGWIPIRPDEEWRSELSHAQQRIVNTIGRPWLVRYGYR